MRILLSMAALLSVTSGLALAQEKKAVSESDEQLRRVIAADTNVVRLAAIDSVQKELGLGDDAGRKLKQLADEYQAAVQKELGDAAVLKRPFKTDQPARERQTADQRQKTLETRKELQSEFIPKTTELLSADQAKRLREIWLQACLKSGPRRLLEEDVALALRLTDDQKKDLNALQAEMREKQFPGGAPVRGGRGDGAITKLFEIQEEYAQKSFALLTPEQKDAFGKGFPFPKLARPGT